MSESPGFGAAKSSTTSNASENWAERLRSKWSRWPPIILIALAVLGISSVATIAEGGIWLTKQYDHRIAWRTSEQQIINSLAASIHIDRFKELLGSNIFLRNVGGYREFVFRRRGYWVQALTDTLGSVEFYAITVDDDSFQPVILNHPSGDTIIVGQTTFADAGGGNLNYFVGVTANTYIMEYEYLGNPGHYQTVIFGFNDAGGNIWPETTWERLTPYVNTHPDPDPEDPFIQAFRSTHAFNTIGFTAPGVLVEELPDDLTWGVDKVQIRVYREPDK
jgi:hypothetical protein